ncbi:MAG: hypothetical protein IT433_03635 [Phycisphaerales bacterium]|nr:hypothetical protein [Phycisphaerales bacterium]
MTNPRGDRSVPGPLNTLSGREPWPQALPRQATLRTSAAALEALAGAAELTGRLCRLAGLDVDPSLAADSIARWHDSQEWPERAIRIGLVNPAAWSRNVAGASGVVPTQCFEVPTAQADHALHTLRMDVLITPDAEGGFVFRTPELPDHEAAWYDWGMPRPISYPSLFPTRLDAANVTLAPSPAGEDAMLMRLLAETLGTLSRHQARLDLTDRLLGRRPMELNPGTCNSLRQFSPTSDIMGRLAAHLTSHLADFRTGATPTSGERAAARVLGAWAAAWPGSIDDATRRASMETAARVCADEAETMMRLAAVRFGCLDDDLGLEALQRALRLMQPDRVVLQNDPAAFLAAELAAGEPGPWTIGRLAVGVALMCATTPGEKCSYFRDDLADDLAHSPILVGRDQDQLLLRRVFAMATGAALASNPALITPSPKTKNGTKKKARQGGAKAKATAAAPTPQPPGTPRSRLAKAPKAKPANPTPSATAETGAVPDAPSLPTAPSRKPRRKAA